MNQACEAHNGDIARGAKYVFTVPDGLGPCPVNTEVKFPSDITMHSDSCRFNNPLPLFLPNTPVKPPWGALRMAVTTAIRALLLWSWRDHSSEHGKCWQSSRRLQYRCSPPNHQYNWQSIFTLLPVSIIPTEGIGYIVIKDSWYHARTSIPSGCHLL